MAENNIQQEDTAKIEVLKLEAKPVAKAKERIHHSLRATHPKMIGEVS